MRHTVAADGSVRESFGYAHYGLGAVVTFLGALKVSGSEDLFGYDNDVLSRFVKYAAYMMTPVRNGFFSFDDSDHGYHISPISLLVALSKFKRDPLAQWVVDKYAGKLSGRDLLCGWTSWEKPLTLLWYQSDLTPVSPEHPSQDLPLTGAYIDDGVGDRWSAGIVVMRTGFDSNDDIAFAIQCGDSGGYHGHPDQGGFILDAYSGHLVGEVGKNGGYGGIGNNWAHKSVSHSIILIDGKGQVEDHKEGHGRNERDGTVDELIHTPFMDYVLANSKTAYDAGGNGVSHAKRHVVFIRKPNKQGYFVLIDDIDKGDNENHEYAWQLHGTQWHRPVLKASENAFSFMPSQDNYWEYAKSYEEGKEASLQVVFAKPFDLSMEVIESMKVKGWHKGKPYIEEGYPLTFPPFIRATSTAKRGLFVSVLYPESTRLKIKMPSVRKLNTETYSGFVVGEDVVLFRTSDSPLLYEGIETDGEILAIVQQQGNRCYMVTSATYCKSNNVYSLKSDEPKSAVWSHNRRWHN
jgi:hypothetical protein